MKENTKKISHPSTFVMMNEIMDRARSGDEFAVTLLQALELVILKTTELWTIESLKNDGGMSTKTMIDLQRHALQKAAHCLPGEEQ